VAVELLECNSFPLGGGLNYLGRDRVLVSIVRDVKLNGSARPVTIEHVINAALDLDDQRHLDHLKAELFAEVVFDIATKVEDRLLRFFSSQERGVILG